MQLKTLGESLNVVKTIDNVVKSCSYLSGTFNENAIISQKLAIALSGYSTEAIKSAIAQSSLNAEQIKAILSAKGLTEAEIEEVIATNSLTASQAGATASTLGLGNAFKGLGASIKAFALSNPILTAIAAVGITIYGAVKAYNALTVSVEEAKEAMDEAISEYESAKSSLQSINSELDEQNKQLDELLAKDKLTYAEKGQLEELQEITRELLLQQDIEERRIDKASKEAAVKTVDAYEKQYGRYDISRENLNGKFEHVRETGIFSLPDGQNDITGNIAAFIRAKELLDNARRNYENALRKGDDTTWLSKDVQSYIDMSEDYSEALSANLSDLQEKRQALEDEYKKVAVKSLKGLEPLTSDEQNTIDTYESIYNAIKLIYEYTNKNAWNDMEISNIFNTAGIEKTKDELIEMAQAGKLTPEVIEGYHNLNSAIQKSELFLEKGQTAAEAFCNEIYGCVNAVNELSEPTDENPISFNQEDYKDQIDEIQSAISTLRSALESFNKGELDKLSVIDLMQEFPSLVPYIDLTADGFGNLSEGLSTLIEQQPDELIQKLNDLKESLNTEEERKQVDLLIDSFQRLSSYGDTGLEAYANATGNTWDGTADVIEGVTTQFENLAKVQEAVANGLTMTATKAAELAKMYPEILTNAELSANGQITLNEEVVNSILAGDQSIINAQIAKLEADKAELTAKQAYAEAQLDIVKQVGEGEGQITKETAQYALDTAEKELKALIEMGNEQDKAYAEVAKSMSSNINEFNRVVAQVAEDSSANMNNAAISMADTIDKNMQNAQQSVNGFIQKAWDMADAINDAKSGIRGGSLTIHSGGGSSKGKAIKSRTNTGNFNTATSEYTPTEINFDEFQSQLELDIQGYTNAISNIDAQIEVLKNLQATFENNGGIGGHGYSDMIKQLEKEKDSLNNSLKADKETKETFDWIETALSRIQRIIKNLGSTVSATWKSWTARNSALASELSNVRKEIELQKAAYNSYKAKADSISLSGHYKQLVRNGSLSIEDITDDTLKEQIKEYKEYYEKALDCADAVSELKDKLAELAQTKFDNISTQYEAKIQDIDHIVNLINGQMEKAEELNQIAGQSFYDALIEKENARIDNLVDEYNAKLASMNEAVLSGTIKRGSEAWQEMKSDIDSVTESIQEANNQVLKYEKSIKEIAKLKFDSLESQFDNALSIITSEMSQVDKQISMIEEAGYLAGESFYNSLIEAEKVHTQSLMKEYETLSSTLKESLDNGSVTKFDENWYAMTGSIRDVEDALLDAQTALIKYSNSLRELEWDVFDRMQNSISEITEESDFLIELMDKNNELYHENGTYNDRGLSVQGLHAVNYDVYMRQAQEYADAIKEINKELADDPNNTKLQDRYKELIKLQREAVLSAEDEKSAIKDLISDGYDKMLSFFDKLISARKKALSEEKDLHDYEKTVSEQTAVVEKYQKILDAYKGDDSEGMKATIQKAQENLVKAQEELSETEYDKYMADQEALLDTFMDELEEWVNIRLDDINGLLQQAIEATNTNAQIISGQINTDLTAVGMTLTENFARIFEIDYSGGVKDIVSGFFGGNGEFSSVMTTVNTTISEVKAKSDEIKVSTDQISNVLNQRFPELAQSMPNLTETNNRIGDVVNAINLVKEAISTIRTDIAQLELNVPDYGDNDNNDSDDDNWDSHWDDTDHGVTITYTPPEITIPTTPAVPQSSGNGSGNKTTNISTNKSIGGGSSFIHINGYDKSLHFYKNGYRRLPNDQIACTQEDGTEFILSPYRGGILTPLCRGDSVLTAEESDRLYQLSQLSPEELREQFFKGSMPEVDMRNVFKQEMAPVNNNSNVNTKNDVTVNITMPNITNKDEINRYFRTSENVRFIRNAVADSLNGKNSLNWYRY